MPNSDAELKGYAEFQRALNEINSAMPKDMQEAGMKIAQDWVNLAKGNTNTRQQALAAQSIRVGSSEETGGSITADSPVFFGAEFGGQARPTTMQFPPHMGTRGYFFYPTARSNAERFNAVWAEQIDKAMKPWDHKESE